MQRGYDARISLETLSAHLRLGGQHPRPPQGDRLLQRRHRLQHLRLQKREATTIQERMRDVIAAATRSNVSIYSIDPRGLTSLADESINVSGGFPDDPSLEPEPAVVPGLAAHLAGQPAQPLGGNRRLRGGEPERLQQRLRARRPGQQLVLRPRLLPEERAPRRPVQAHRGQGEAAGPRGPVAPRLYGAAGKAAVAENGAQRSDVAAGARAARQPAADQRHQAARGRDAVQGQPAERVGGRRHRSRRHDPSTSRRRTASC